MLRTLFFSTHVLWTPHYETELELMEKHLQAGDEVTHVECNTQLLPCDQNFQKNLGICINCINKKNLGRNLLSKPVKRLVFPASAGKTDYRFHDVASLQNISFEEFDLGFAVASSYLSIKRIIQLNLPEDEGLIQEMLYSAQTQFSYWKAHFEANRYDVVYVFNGRLFHTRALLRAAHAAGLNVQIHERGANTSRYALFDNHLPHNIQKVVGRIENQWNAEPNEMAKEQIASQWYTQRRGGVEQSWYSFVAKQSKGKLPEGWNEEEQNIVLFNSSEDEYASIGTEWQRFIFPNQLEGILAIGKICAAQPGHRVYLRCHPNMAAQEIAILQSSLQSAGSPVVMIDSKADIDTYALVDAADKVVSFGSTVGIEAVYWGKPSISLASSFYRGLGSTYNPETLAELEAMLLQTLPPKDRRGALMYGYYLHTFGASFEHYKPEGVGKGHFKGVNLKQPSKTFAQRILLKMPAPIAETIIRQIG